LAVAASAAVAIACCLASARRLERAVAPTPLDLSLLKRAVHEGARANVASALAGDPALSWESAVFAAAGEPDREVRGALLGEFLTDLEGRVQDGARIPRVCASIATSAGFLCATAVLLQGLAAVPDGEPLLAAEGLLVSSLGALVAGVAGATFCAAVHLRARRASRTRVESAEALVGQLLDEPGI
jgi:hypothetical protein